MNLFQQKVSKWTPWGLVAAFALLPFSSQAANVSGLLVLILWLIEGGLKEKWAEIRRNPVATVTILYVLMLCLGLLWTSDLDWGLHVIKKSRRFLLLPVFLSVATRDPWVFRHGLYAFLASAAVTVIFSLGLAAQWIPLFGHATPVDPSPFVYHVSYGPELAWAAYLLFAAVLFDPELSRYWKPWLCGAGVFILAGLFFNIGVAGYAAAFMLSGLLILQWRKTIIWPALAMVLLAGAAYIFSPAVHCRVNQNLQEVVNYRQGEAKCENPESGTVQNKSIGPRLVFWENTWQIIKKHPLLGVGTGDFSAEYEKVRQARTPNHWENVNNPHNMYLMVLAQTGVLGLSVFLWLFAAILRQSRRLPAWEAKITVGLLCFILLIMMSDAYMQIAHTSLLFVLFAGVFGRARPASNPQ